MQIGKRPDNLRVDCTGVAAVAQRGPAAEFVPFIDGPGELDPPLGEHEVVIVMVGEPVVGESPGETSVPPGDPLEEAGRGEVLAAGANGVIAEVIDFKAVKIAQDDVRPGLQPQPHPR